MSYSDFTLPDIEEKLGLTLRDREALFPGISAIEYSQHLHETLRLAIAETS